MRVLRATQSTETDQFWAAIEIAAYGTLDKDIVDLGRYVASRGSDAAADFLAELSRTVAALREAGVGDSLRRGSNVTPDGRRLADLPDDELDHALETIVLAGKRYTRILLNDPGREGGGSGEFRLVDLRHAVEQSLVELSTETTPLWVEKPRDRRRDGSLWIDLDLTRGAGVPSSDSAPWTIRGFRERFLKAAIVRSLDDSWREWREHLGIRTLDVWLLYSVPGSEVERVEVKSTGSKAAVTVYRDFPRLVAPGDPIEIAEREADSVFDAIRAILS